jgi:hypothetical protein
MNLVIIPKKVILHKENKIQHFFKCEDGFMVRNLKFSIRYNKSTIKKWRLRIQIWLPLIHIVRDNSKWEIGNKYRLYIYH